MSNVALIECHCPAGNRSHGQLSAVLRRHGPLHSLDEGVQGTCSSRERLLHVTNINTVQSALILRVGGHPDVFGRHTGLSICHGPLYATCQRQTSMVLYENTVKAMRGYYTVQFVGGVFSTSERILLEAKFVTALATRLGGSQCATEFLPSAAGDSSRQDNLRTLVRAIEADLGKENPLQDSRFCMRTWEAVEPVAARLRSRHARDASQHLRHLLARQFPRNEQFTGQANRQCV